MALTNSQKLEKPQNHFNVRHSGQAAAGTYKAGELVRVGGDDGYIKPVSASTVAGTVGVGIVATDQTVVTTGDYLVYHTGLYFLSGSGFTQKDINKPFWCSDSSLGVFQAQGTNRIPMGRFRGTAATLLGSNNGIFEIGGVVSGTLATTIY